MILHTVSPGQTLSDISARYGVPLSRIAAWNALAPPYALAVGQSLLIPEAAEIYTVLPGDTRNVSCPGWEEQSIARSFVNTTAQSAFARTPTPLVAVPLTAKGPALVRKTVWSSFQYQPGPAALPVSTPLISRPVGTKGMASRCAPATRTTHSFAPTAVSDEKVCAPSGSHNQALPSESAVVQGGA